MPYPFHHRSSTHRCLSIRFSPQFYFFLEKNDECPPFIALRITANDSNGLVEFPNKLSSRESYKSCTDDRKYKGLIVLEVADVDNTHGKLMSIEEKVDILSPYIGKHCSNQLDVEAAKMLAHAIIEDKEKEEKEKERRNRTRASNKRKTRGAGDDKVVLVWPFEMDVEERERVAKKAGEKVFEAGKAAEGEVSSSDEESVIEDNSDGEDDARNVTADTSASNGNTSVNTSVDSTGSDDTPDFDIFGADGGDDNDDENDDTRAQASSPPDGGGGCGVKKSSKDRVTITSSDISRLAPTEFLNDNLIDFWMKWVARSDNCPGKFKFFTSHFYSTLRDEGVEGVKRWTKDPKKLLKNEFIFCPINESLHWSLAIICNPGSMLGTDNQIDCDYLNDACDLLTSFKDLRHSNEDNDSEEDADIRQRANGTKTTSIFVLDSLRAHNKTKIANNLRKWLQEVVKAASPESKTDVIANALSKNNIRTIAPKVPIQANSWDCGVFVCQYANAFYRAATRPDGLSITIANSTENNLLMEQNEFNFDMASIDPLREEMKDLIEGLGEKYAKFREIKVEKEMKEKREEKRAKALEDKLRNEEENERLRKEQVEASGDPDGDVMV